MPAAQASHPVVVASELACVRQCARMNPDGSEDRCSESSSRPVRRTSTATCSTKAPQADIRPSRRRAIGPVSISTLGEILGVGPYDDLIDEVSEGRAAESGEAGVFTIPPRMRDALATPDLDAGSVAAKWAATDELSDWAAEDVKLVVRELAALAQDAKDKSRHLFFWWSL
jgi:hypothetical protein